MDSRFRGNDGGERGARILITALSLTLALTVAALPAAAESIKLGLLKTGGNGGIFVAQERGYFTGEGLAVDLVFFEAALPIAVATVSGDVDVGSTALVAGFYNLAAQGALRVIAAQSADVPGFQNNTVVASNHAYDSGLKSYRDLGGHSIAITTAGSSPQYSAVLLAEKYHIDLATIRFLALQTTANTVSAVIGGQADVAVGPAAAMLPIVQRGEGKLLGFAGDEVPYQLGAVFTTTKAADARGDMLARFLRAYRKGTRDYHDAFTGPDEKRRDGPQASAIIDILAKSLGQPAEQLKSGISYLDADARLDAKDVQHQIDWYKSQGLMKGDLNSGELLDKRYATILPGRQD